jgi:hypothetical protein
MSLPKASGQVLQDVDLRLGKMPRQEDEPMISCDETTS